MTVDEIVSQAWAEHAQDAAAVMERLPAAVAVATTPADRVKVAALVTHVAGEHLGRWDDGIALLERLRARPGLEPTTPEAKSISRSIAVLQHGAGRDAEAESALAAGLSGGGVPEASDRARVLALVASALTGQRRIEEAGAALRAALDLVASHPTLPGDPAVRALAVTGNNLACELEARPSRTPEERALMLLAAQAGLDFWSIAGGWLEQERAHYRLAMSCLAAGDAERAGTHAARCQAIVEENGADPFESFFAHEVVARARHAAGDRAGALEAAERAEAILARLADASRREHCEGEMGRLRRALAL
jgi:hypothetical protein